MNKPLASVLLLLLFISCQNQEATKETAKENAYFSVVSYLNAQAKDVDTSLYRITRITREDDRVDTAIVAREEFRSLARDFLSLPDISKGTLHDQYTEELSYDQDLNSSVINYTPKDPNLPVTRETLLMETNDNANTDVKTIIINTRTNQGDSTVVKDLTWHVGHRFQVVTKVSKANAGEAIHTLVVTWE